MFPRIKPWHIGPLPNRPWVADIRTCDVPETIARAILNLPAECVAITLRPYGGRKMKSAAEAAALERGVRIIWVPLRGARLLSYFSVEN